jgi:O-antigen/teichoic acid export membrane protein
MGFPTREIRRLPLPSLRQLIALSTTRTGVVVLTNVGSLLVRTISSVILTRLLTPQDFGIVGIIGAVFFVLGMITDLGFTAFVVPHQRGDERHFRDVIWTIHAGRGLALALLAAVASPAVAWVLGKPPLALPLAVASVTFFLNGIASLSLITALRHHSARKLSVLDLVLQVFQTIACLSLALWWRNAWAMIAGMVLQSALRVVLSYTWFSDSKQSPARDPAISREFLAFSKLILATSASTLVILQTDKLVLARLFSLEQFGLYALALSLASAPMAIGDSYISRVVFPVYAQIWRTQPDAIADVYYRVRRSASLLYAFACGGLIGGAHLLVTILYDPRYAGAGTWLSLLVVSVALRLPNVAASQLLVAMGDIKSTLQVNVVRLIWLAIAMPLGYLQFGAVGVVASVGLLEAPAMLYSWLLLRRKHVLDLRQELLFVAMVIFGAAVAFGVASQIHLAHADLMFGRR